MNEPVIIIQGVSLAEFWAEHERRTRAILVDVISEFNSKEEDPLLSPKEVCSMLRISRQTLHKYTKVGSIRKLTVGAKVYYKKSEVEKLMKAVNYLHKPTG